MRHRLLTAALVLMLLSSAGLATVASAAQIDAAIQSVEMSVDDPAPGEPFTLTTKVANLQSSSGPVDVTDVYVRKRGQTDEYDRIENVGSISPGSSLSIPMTMTFDDPGKKRLTVYVVVRDDNGTHRRLQYPIYVDVEEPDETAISFSTGDLVAGEESQVNVSVSNGDNGTLSNVRLDLSGDGTVENPERVTGSIQPGSQVTNSYQVTFSEAGEQTLEATVTYKTASGVTRTTTRTVTVDVNEAEVDTELTATAGTINGSSVIEATLTEYGNAELRDVEVKAMVDGEVVARTQGGDVPAKGSRTYTLDGADVADGSVTVVAQYTAAGEERTVSKTIEYNPQETSNIALTGIEVIRQGSTLTLSGDVANLGSADARSVLLSVADAGGVSPVSPDGEYFVGTIESSEFATFELTASADANGSVESVPVQISYSTDGERVEQTVEIDISGASGTGAMVSGSGDGSVRVDGGAAGPARSTSVPGLPLIEIVVGAVLLVVAAVGYGAYRWRQQ